MFILFVKTEYIEYSKRFSSYKSLRQFVRRNKYIHWIVKDELSNEYIVELNGKLVILSTAVKKVQELQKSINDFYLLSLRKSK